MNKLKTTIRNYGKKNLTEASCPSDPINLFTEWLNDAMQHEPYEPNAMTVATVDKQGFPSARILLLKDVGPEGFVFFTNYDSAKGQEIATNSRLALTFWWPATERQVRVQGIAEKTSVDVSSDYFQTRSKESKIGAHVSNQSQVIANREVLDKQFSQLQAVYTNTNEIPRPEHWGGYQIKPMKIEFWQGGPHRLHDRICYEKVENNWKIYRLAP